MVSRYNTKQRKTDDELQIQEEERASLIHLILFAQKFMKEAALEYVRVSLRDILFSLIEGLKPFILIVQRYYSYT